MKGLKKIDYEKILEHSAAQQGQFKGKFILDKDLLFF